MAKKPKSVTEKLFRKLCDEAAETMEFEFRKVLYEKHPCCNKRQKTRRTLICHACSVNFRTKNLQTLVFDIYNGQRTRGMRMIIEELRNKNYHKAADVGSNLLYRY